MIRPALLLSLLFVVGFCYVQQSPPAYQPPAAYPPYQQPGYGYPVQYFWGWFPHWWSSSSSHSHERRPPRRRPERDSCRPLKYSCSDVQDPSTCFKPDISYGKDRSTKKADIRCPLPNIVLSITTPQNATLATGMGAEKIVTCYSGRWTGQTSDGKFVEFDTVRCTTPPPVEPPQ